MKNCVDCKYFMWGSCMHKYDCNHYELWTPVWYGEIDLNLIHLSDTMLDLIKLGIYTEEEMIDFIKRTAYKKE